MKIKQLSGWVFISLCGINAVNADTSISTISNGSNAPSIIGHNATVNYGYSKKDVDEIVADYAKQRKLDAEQIKALTTAITALTQGKGITATKSQIKAAIDALANGHTEKAKALFKQETQRVEIAAKQGAEAYRNLGALAFLDNTQEALQAYRRATQLDPDNADGWNRLGHLLRRVGELDEAIITYQTVLTLGEASQDKELLAVAYGNLGNVYQTRGELDKAIEFYQKSLVINKELGRKEGMASDYANLGNVYKLKGNKTKAKDYYQKSIKLFQYLSSPNEKLVQGWLDSL